MLRVLTFGFVVQYEGAINKTNRGDVDMNSTSKFNVGDKVRVVEAPEYKGSKRFIGKQLVVRDFEGRVAGGNVYFEGFGDSRHDCVLGDDLELVPAKLTKSRRIDALEKDVARQETEIAELKEAVEALKKPKTHADMLSEAFKALESQQLPKSLTPNQRRAQIIADAKNFVEQTIEDARDSDGDISVPPYSCSHIKFEINAEKRTVVALAIGYETGSVVQKAIAKCATDDVFNADIGKAIAVGRLFNRDVERFINAPKPTEFVVGHVVQIAHTSNKGHVYGVGKITEVTSSTNRYYYDSATFKSYAYRPTFRGPIGTPDGSKILDDTEAQYV